MMRGKRQARRGMSFDGLLRTGLSGGILLVPYAPRVMLDRSSAWPWSLDIIYIYNYIIGPLISQAELERLKP